MATIDDLLARVVDASVRAALADEISQIKRRSKFGLVFEQHLPEVAVLPGLPIRKGALVRIRTQPNDETVYRVRSVDGDDVQLETRDGTLTRSAYVTELHVIKDFGDPIYPTLTSLGSVERGGGKPFQAVINGENYHALQLMTYMWEGQADVIYLDPPYNTGARDWKYNNSFVDQNDQYRHSKWLSFMDRRLRLARRLLKPDGVLIVTIDEHELVHLGMLLEQIFPEYLRYTVTIVINPKGTAKTNFSRVDEQAFFCVPRGAELIREQPITEWESAEGLRPRRRNGNTQLALQVAEADDESEDQDEVIPEDQESDDDPIDEDPGPAPGEEYEYQHARRRGAESSYRDQRPGQFYPIYVDIEKGFAQKRGSVRRNQWKLTWGLGQRHGPCRPKRPLLCKAIEKRVVVRAGDALPPAAEPDFSPVDGLTPIFPIDKELNHRCWRFAPASMQKRILAGNVVFGRYDQATGALTLNIRVPKKKVRKLKTVWWQTRHDAGTHGTGVLKKLLGRPGLFPFPKSVYAVRDCLKAVVGDRPNALIIDVFAGSGTTLHATCLLNAELGGQRRCILVTNNEVGDRAAKRFHRRGIYRGDPEFEARGVYELVTRPRCEAVVTGCQPDGTSIPGKHVGGRPFAAGFEENVEFFRLDYLDSSGVELGRRFEAIHPLLWLMAGGVGPRPSRGDCPYLIPEGAPYAVLLNEWRFRAFAEALRARPDISEVFLVTDSEENYSEMRYLIGARRRTSMLYRDYLRTFRMNTARAQ